VTLWSSSILLKVSESNLHWFIIIDLYSVSAIENVWIPSLSIKNKIYEGLFVRIVGKWKIFYYLPLHWKILLAGPAASPCFEESANL